jgi:putative DNA primase/helicase
MDGKITISEKQSSKRRCTEERALPSVECAEIEHFDHSPINMTEDDIYEMYMSFRFVLVKAKKTEKRPVFSGWTKSEFDDNTKIDSAKNNVAIVTGEKSGIFVLDVDIKDNGLQWFQSFCSLNKFNYVNYTTCVITPSGGLHLYFKYDAKIGGNRVRMKDDAGRDIGLDIRSNDGCVIAPPSKYEFGEYKFVSVKNPQKCPGFILELFK